MEILRRPSLRDLTTLRMGGCASSGVRIRCEADWEELSSFLQAERLTPVCLGRGSNILAREGDLALVLVLQTPMRELKTMHRQGDRIRIEADAGMHLGRLLARLQKLGLSGLEGLIGIPGSLGGAVAMNAGAYGYDISRVLARVRIWSPRGGLQWLEREELRLGYREFLPQEPGFFCITSAELDLEQNVPEEVRRRMRHFYRTKRRAQPVQSMTCGCVFKNPHAGPAAGELLERCGFRGFYQGEVGFSEQHANFLINSGGGRADQALELMERAKTAVRRNFAVDLEREVRLLE
ncbi:MAG: UDP-N-acetylmuramate dehydrogenase [Desulfohalobiaceae bacterium]|nr:UDP-N-acetylmuramate dehydrogenase [Desulfohalobiaceae bacterium]